MKENFKVKVSNKSKVEKFFKKKNFLIFAMNYLETLQGKIDKLTLDEIIDFYEMDKKINEMVLNNTFKIFRKAIMDISKIKVVEGLGKNQAEDIIKALKSFTAKQKIDHCKNIDLGLEHFESLIIHMENVDFMRHEVLIKQKSLFSFKDKQVIYSSLYEYMYFCIKFLLSEAESFVFKAEIKHLVKNNEKVSKELIDYFKKESLNFID
jgi:hypothetical protein